MIVNNEQNIDAQVAQSPAAAQPTVDQPVVEPVVEDAPVETESADRQTVVEAPKIDLSNSTDTPPLPEDSAPEETDPPQEAPAEPKRTFSNRKAYKWLYDFNYANGEVLSDEQIDMYARQGINRKFASIYRQFGQALPPEEELVSIYDSFFDVEEVQTEAEVEKKNSVESDSTTTSPNVLEQDSTESESPSLEDISGSDSGFESPDYNSHIPKFDDTSLPDLIKESDVSWMTMSEREADLAFEDEYARFGFSATQTDVGDDRLIITAPDGSTKTVRLYTESATNRIDWVNAWQTGNTNTGDYRMDIAIEGMRDWMISKVEDVGITQMLIRNSMNTDATSQIIFQTLTGRAMLTGEEKFDLINASGDDFIMDRMNSYYSDGSPFFDVTKAKSVINEIYTYVYEHPEEYDNQEEVLDKLVNISNGMTHRMRTASSVIGGAIASDPNQGHFDLSNDDYQMELLIAAGMSMDDMSFGQNLQINGRPATYGEFMHLVSDYDGINEVRRRGIELYINPDVQGTIARQMLSDLAQIKYRNDATPILSDEEFQELVEYFGSEDKAMAMNEMNAMFVIGKDKAVDMFQSLLIGVGNLFANIQKANPMTSMRIGNSFVLVPKKLIKDQNPDWKDGGDLLKELIEDTRAEWLPYYDSGIMDANSFGEVLAKGGNTAFESLPITAAFLYNPTLGLTLTYANGYGENLYNIEQRQLEAQEALNSGYYTDAWKQAEIEKLATMSRFEQQAYAHTMAGIETGITRLFTYNYFKGIAGAKNFAGPHSAANARTLANEYGKQFYTGYISRMSKALGVQPKVLMSEFAEEESIMLSNYAVEVLWGLRDYDSKELEAMIYETGAQTIFTAAGMAKLGTTVQNSRVTSAVNSFMRSNMTTNAEQQSLQNFMTAQQQLEQMQEANERAELEAKGQEDLQGPTSKPYTDAQINEQQQLVDKFGGELMTHKNKKDELIDQMTPEDKYEFLQAMEEVKRYAETVRENPDANIAEAAVPKMNQAKERARAVMAKYPSSAAFDYMSVENRANYMDRAVQSLIENEYAGQDVIVSYVTNGVLDEDFQTPTESAETQGNQKQIPTEQIIEKAKELYLQDVAEGKVLGDGTRIIENTTAKDAERNREIPREVRQGFNVQDYVDQIRENEKAKGMQGDSDISVEAVPQEVQMDKQDRIDELNAERQAAIEQAKNEGSFGQEPVQGKGEGTEIQPPEVTKRIEEINAEYDAKIAQVQGDAKRVVPVNEQGQVDDVSVINENSFTHKTRSKEAIENWANSGQVVGANEDLNSFNDKPNESLLDAQTKDQNRQSPNFQKGKLYGSGTKDVAGGFVIVSKDGKIVDGDVVPNSGFVNQSSLDESNGIGVLNPAARSIENFDLYSVNEDGSLTKRDWSEFKTQDDGSTIGDANNTPRVNTEVSRDAQALNRIEVMNTKTDILSYLNNSQKDIIIGFMLDMKNGDKTRVGEVENILNALDIAIEIKTELGEKKIDIYTTEGNAAVMAIINNALDMYTGSLSSKVGTLATTTVLMKNLFSDSKVGKPFIDLNNEAGRRVDATKQSNAKRMQEHIDLYKQDAQNDPEWANASARERKAMSDPNHINNSYELSMLSVLRREMGELDKEGMDVEFARNKELILQQLDIRRSNYEADAKLKPEDRNPKYEAQYLAYKAMVDKLGIADAKSYEDVAVRASGRNVQAVQRWVDMQPNAEAMEYLKRYADFDPTELTTYLPSFYQYNEGEVYVDRIGYQDENNRSNTAGQTKDATMPTKLVNDATGMSLQLAPGNYWNQMYGALQGLELEINARDQYRQISQLMDMPQFQQLFEGNEMNDRGEMITSPIYNRLADAFKMREDIFEKDIRSSHFGAIDIGEVDPAQGAWSSTVQAAYSTASALVLTGVTQNIRQYQSAVSGVMPLLTSKEARAALNASNLRFYTGTGHATSGVEGRTWAVRQLRGLLGSNDYASNIYAQSRTGLRNSLGSELIVDRNKKMPMSYYLRNWGLVDVKEGASQEEIDAAEQEVVQRFENYGLIPDSKIPELYTWKQAMDLISSSNNATLELLLANGDRAAANATFEALYIDYRIKQGAKFDKGFWERENANPNIEAINYADQKIDETQKQTTSTSQAGLYSDYSSQFSNNLTKFVVPFGSFTFNTRSAILSNMQILQDPDIDPEQKQQAQRFLQGKVREIGYFEGIKALGVVGLYQGIPGLAQLFGVVDEDDIERYGGATGLIGDMLLPIEDRDLSSGDFVDMSSLTDISPNEATSTEQYNAVNELVNSGLQATEYNATEAARLLMTYENKLKINPYNINIAEKITADLAKMMNPVPRPDLVDDGAKAMWNYTMMALGAEDLTVTEFMTQDMKSIGTKDGLYAFIMDNAGIVGILGQEYENLNRAITLSQEGMLYKRNTMSAQGVTGVAITSLNPEIRKRLDDATNYLLYFRMAAAFAPGVPKQDLNKIADKMERQLEEIYDAIGTDKFNFDPKDPNLNIKPTQEEQQNADERQSVLDQF